MSVAVRAVLSVPVLAMVCGALIFGAAGTLDYWQAWIYLNIFTVASLLITLHLIKRGPELLQRRMRGGPAAEKRSTQRVIMLFVVVVFLCLLVIPGYDRRYGWSSVADYVVIAADLLVALGFYFIFRVYRENTYTSATIEVAANQKIITTGPYDLVRHP